MRNDESVHVIVVTNDDHEVLSPGARIKLTLEWLTQNATVNGKGLVDHMTLSPAVTAYFDNDGANSAAVSCLLFPDKGESVAIAGPVVLVCWEARSSSEALVTVAQHMSVTAPPVPTTGPYIHPTWPTLQ